jgi:hypothetical protein
MAIIDIIDIIALVGAMLCCTALGAGIYHRLVLRWLDLEARVLLRRANWRRRAYVDRGGEHLLDQAARLDRRREALIDFSTLLQGRG